MSLKSAKYYIGKADEAPDLQHGIVYANLAQAEMLISIEYVLQQLLTAITEKEKTK